MPFLTSRPQARATFFTTTGNIVASSFLSDTTSQDQIKSIVTHKSLGDPAGRFEITLTPQAEAQGAGWKDVLRIGDMVVIEMGPDRPQPPDTWYAKNYGQGISGVEIVMIGTIDDVRFSSQMGGNGRPAQTVTISGRDFGKYLVDDIIWFDPWHEPVLAILKWKGLLVEFPKIGLAGTPGAIFDLILNSWIFAQFDVTFDITTKGPVTALGQRSLSQILRYVFDKNTPILPYSQNLTTYEGTPWSMMQTVQNSPWYVLHQDVRRSNDITLLTSRTGSNIDSAIRPATPNVNPRAPTVWNSNLGTFNSQVCMMYYRNPWSNRHYEDWTKLPTRVITDDDILNFDVGRTIDDVFNRWQVLAYWPALGSTIGAQERLKNEAADLEFRYGFRPRILKTTFSFDNRDAIGNQITETFTERLRDWDILNELWLNGQFLIKGMAAARCGDRLHYDQPNKAHRGVDFYIESVTQEWQALTSWTTTLGVTRGQPHRDAGVPLFDTDGNALLGSTDPMVRMAARPEV